MNYLRSALIQLYRFQVACYSGRGGEIYKNGEWCIVAKEQIKRQFWEKEIKILLCTESASEGLNMQTCGVLFNYDMPWNPMRVEQRIGRIDRIGQVHPTVTIVPQLWSGAVVVMDNLPGHQIASIEPLIAAVGASILNLSPYSPDFNPIELWWSQLKAFLRQFSPTTTKRVDILIATALALVNPEHLRNWFANCYCTSSH